MNLKKLHWVVFFGSLKYYLNVLNIKRNTKIKIIFEESQTVSALEAEFGQYKLSYEYRFAQFYVSLFIVAFITNYQVLKLILNW